MKRRENIFLSLENGELHKLAIENPFSVVLLNYKVPIVKFDISKDKEHLIIID